MDLHEGAAVPCAMADDDEALIHAAMALLAYDEDIQLESVMAERWHQITREAREGYIAKAGTAIATFLTAKAEA